MCVCVLPRSPERADWSMQDGTAMSGKWSMRRSRLTAGLFGIASLLLLLLRHRWVAAGLPLGISSHHCTWDALPRPRSPDVQSASAVRVGAFLRFLDRTVRSELGYRYVLTQGSLLGAVRHGGLIPHDRDLDATLLLPANETIHEVRAAIAAALQAVGSPFAVETSDDGVSRWLRLVDHVLDQTHGTPVVADLHVYPSVRLQKESKLRAAFAASCRCTFSSAATDGPPVAVEAACFEHAPDYLSSLYGDWRVPSHVHAEREGLAEDGWWPEAAPARV